MTHPAKCAVCGARHDKMFGPCTMTTGSRVCEACGVSKPLEKFARDARFVGGYGRRCSFCKRTANEHVPEVAIIIPVLRRPQLVPTVVESIRSTTHSARILFVCDIGDGPEQDAISQMDCEWVCMPDGSTYAQKINHGVEVTEEGVVVLAADDLVFQRSWLRHSWTKGRGRGAGCVGLNDGILRPIRPDHATHFVMDRSYAELPCLDGSPGPASVAYRHCFVDNEIVATAKLRGQYKFVENSRVIHNHPSMGTAPIDDTYRIGYDHMETDRAVFESRKHLWTG